MKLIQGDCLEVLKTLPDNSVDAVVTDPPYGLKFMGKKWDYDVPSVDVWREIMRVLKHGGHALVACGTRTQHRMALNIEDAGFEIRDVITWLYGSGFPKSLDVSKAIDKQAGAEREVIGVNFNVKGRSDNRTAGQVKAAGNAATIHNDSSITAPSTDAAKQWQGWGTALKPACEFWTLARKPLSEKTVAENVLKWGVGGINIDGCRIEYQNEQDAKEGRSARATTSKGHFATQTQDDKFDRSDRSKITGRFPANLILDEQAAFMLDEQSGHSISRPHKNKTSGKSGVFNASEGEAFSPHNDSGGASRFFYCAKASKSERNAGLEGMPEKDRPLGISQWENQTNGSGEVMGPSKPQANHHPTVKPIKLMQYLCRLITPPNGIVLDPFMGSGSTGVAAKNEGFDFIGIEREPEYKEIAEKRIEAASNGN